MENQPDLIEMDQCYRLWLVELDEQNPSTPLRCDSLDELYQAIIDRQRRSSEPPVPGA